MNFKKSCLLFVILLLSARISFAGDDLVLKAMGDEMSRSINMLRMDAQLSPYFISYTVNYQTRCDISASFGALNDSEPCFNYGSASVDVRVGSKAFDSSGYAGDNFNLYKPVNSGIPEQPDYDAVRTELWKKTDLAYKKAIETYSAKKAFIAKKGITDFEGGDLTVEKPQTVLEEPLPEPELDLNYIRGLVKELSNIFRKYPSIQKSSVNFMSSALLKRFLNSEGARYRINNRQMWISCSADIRTKEGLFASNSEYIQFEALSEITSKAVLTAKIDKFAQEMSALATASTMTVYMGPVIFEDQAAAELFNQLLLRNVSFPKPPFYDYDDTMVYAASGKFSERLGKRVTAPFISVEDEPGRKTYNGEILRGYYPVDNQGVIPGRLELVKDGILKNYYMSRTPTKDFSFSNGHGRGGLDEYSVGRPGNVFISSAKTVSREELKKTLLKTAAELGQPYALIVREMLTDVSIRYPALVSAPLRVYKVFVSDGHEELVNGAQFSEVSYRILRDILMTSDEKFVYNTSSDSLFRQSNNSVWISIVTPSLLIGEIEMKYTDKKPEHKPYLPHPYFAK